MTASLFEWRLDVVLQLFVGVLIWEIFTGGTSPYPGQKNPEVVHMVCQERKYLSKPEHCSEALYKIMVQCWRYVSLEDVFIFVHCSLVDVTYSSLRADVFFFVAHIGLCLICTSPAESKNFIKLCEARSRRRAINKLLSISRNLAHLLLFAASMSFISFVSAFDSTQQSEGKYCLWFFFRAVMTHEYSQQRNN